MRIRDARAHTDGVPARDSRRAPRISGSDSPRPSARSKLEAKIGHRRMKQMERAANARGNATAKATGKRKLYDARRRAKAKARRKDANDEGAAATKALATTLALPRKRRRKDAPTRVEEYIEPANLCDRYVHWIMKRAACSRCWSFEVCGCKPSDDLRKLDSRR